MKLHLIVPGDPEQRTGGYLYDARIVKALRQRGWTVEVAGLDGAFPITDRLAADSMQSALEQLPDGDTVLIDGLALGGLPDSATAHGKRLRLLALVHHPLGEETGLDASTRERLLDSERRALSACQAIIVTSPFTARRLVELGLTARPVHVVEPGVDAAELAFRARQRLEGPGDDGPERLLCVASLTPRKGQDLLIRALANLIEMDWYCTLVGSPDRDPAHAARIGQLIHEHALGDRIELAGEADAAALNAAYRDASLCVLPSWYEGYGMVITEALARGLPLISTTGGALADTVPEAAALRVPPGDARALEQALSHWFQNPSLRVEKTLGAAFERETLADWNEAGERFDRIVRAVMNRGSA